jgi:6-phosphogluconolactonase
MKSLLLSVLIAFRFFAVNAQDHYLLVGTYDSPKSEGVYVYSFNSTDGSSREISHIKTSNPSYVAVSPNEKYVYAVHEIANNGKGGEIAAFSFNKSTGNLSFINQQLTGGDHPCYVAVDRTGKWVFAGNYTSGSLSVLPVNADGGLGAATTTIQHSGSGKDMQRQSGPHVHCTMISPDNKWLFVPDLGIDKVMIYSFDAATGKLVPAKQQFMASEPGAGPRHFTFHPNNKFAYLIEELSGTVETFKYKKGKLTRIQRISSMPAGDTSFAGSADIHVSPDGKFLYASNRSTSNTIAIYSVDSKTGLLKYIAHQSTLGKAPRNFNFDPSGNFLLVGNQNSDEIVIFKRDVDSGLLTDTGKRISVGKPVCIKWISKVNGE